LPDGLLDWIDERDHRFGVHQLSDGSLRAIAWITALAQPARRVPSFPSFDEPELGLHPAAVALLCELVESVAPHAQVLLATQSPALLDYLPVESIVVTERTEGATTLRRLEEDGLRNWIGEYSVSELFDKNVLGGRP
jgi:predicted ATPase